MENVKITPEEYRINFQERIDKVDSVSKQVKKDVLSSISKKTKNRGINFQSLVKHQKNFDELKSKNSEISIKMIRDFDRSLESFLRRAGFLESGGHLTLFSSTPDVPVILIKEVSNDQLLSRIHNGSKMRSLSTQVEFMKNDVLEREGVNSLSRKRVARLIETRGKSYNNFQTFLSAQKLLDEFLSYWLENFPKKSLSIGDIKRCEIKKFNKLHNFFWRAGLSTEDDIKAFSLDPSKLDKVKFRDVDNFLWNDIEKKKFLDEFFSQNKSWSLYKLEKFKNSNGRKGRYFVIKYAYSNLIGFLMEIISDRGDDFLLEHPFYHKRSEWQSQGKDDSVVMTSKKEFGVDKYGRENLVDDSAYEGEEFLSEEEKKIGLKESRKKKDFALSLEKSLSKEDLDLFGKIQQGEVNFDTSDPDIINLIARCRALYMNS